MSGALPAPARGAASGRKLRVLIGDDDRDLTGALATFLDACDFEVVAAITTGGLDVLYAYQEFAPDLVLLDVMMPRFNGITISHAILSRAPHAKIILMSGRMSPEHPFIRNSGAARFLRKPLRLETVRQTINEVLSVPALVAA